jgi:hypothetical protein
MKTRLALVACNCATEGVWTLVKGNERGLRINPLVEGELIWLDLDFNGSIDSVGHNSAGQFAFDFGALGAKRYRVRKTIANEVQPSETWVEVLLDHKLSGNSDHR